MSTNASIASRASDSDILRDVYANFAAGEVSAVLAVLADDISWHVPGEHPLSGDYTGHDGVLRLFSGLAERSGNTFTVTVETIVEDGAGAVAAVVTEHARRGEVELDESTIHLCRMDAGKIVSYRCYHDNDAITNAFWS